MVKKICALLAAMLLIPVTAFAGELYKTDVRQIYCYSDMLRVYTDIEDREGNPIQNPGKTNTEGYIDGVKLVTKDVKSFKDTNEGVADIFLVDISGSIKDSQMEQVKSAIKTWAQNMKQNDKMAVIAFGDDVKTLIDFSSDKNAVSSAVDGIKNNDKNTRLYGGIAHALKLASRDDKDLPKRKNIVLITDGVNDYAGGISEADVYAQLKSSLVPVYSMWMSNSRADNSAGRTVLNSVAEYSGGTMYDMSNKSINTVYEWIKQSILNSYTIDFAYAGAVPDNAEHSFNIRVVQNGKTAEDSVNFVMRMTQESSGTYKMDAASNEAAVKTDEVKDENKKLNKKLIIVLVAAIVLLLTAAIILIVVMRRKGDGEEDFDQDYFSAGAYGNGAGMNYPRGYDAGRTIGGNYGGSSLGGMLTLCSDTGENISVPLSDRMTVGRSSHNDILINSFMVSGNHAVFEFDTERLYITDTDSLNGTLVNGMVTEGRTEVNNGDTVTFGDKEYKVIF